MTSKKNLLKVLDKGDIEMIHGATLEVLEKVGILIDSPEAIELLSKNGYEVDRKTKIVKMSEEQISAAVKSCKHNFRWSARSEKHSFDFVDGRTKFGPGAQCLYYIDPYTEEVRPATLKDGIVMCRLLDALDSCALGYVPLHPHDVPEGASSPVLWAAGILNSSKPTFGGWANDREWDMMLRIVEILTGDRETISKRCLFPGYIDPISPLGHDRNMLQTLVRYQEAGQPVFVMVMALAGGTGPSALAGLLVQQNAEILSSVAIARCVTKSPKIVYGCVSCPLDMRSGAAATGSPEFSLLGVGAVQMAQYYNIPSDMGVQSDSKIVDEQTSYEKMQAALMAVMSGADFAELFMGSTEQFNTTSPVQLMIDDEIASSVQRIANGIQVDPESLSVDVITKIGPLGNFLKHPKTLAHFRRQHFMPRLSDRSTRQQWSAAGSKGTKKRALERMEALLKNHVPEPLEPEQRKAFDQLLAEMARGYTVKDLELTS